MKFFLIILFCFVSLEAMSLKQVYKTAFNYAKSGNYPPFKNLVTQYDLLLDENDNPAETKESLMHSVVHSASDIQNSKLMIEFLKTRNANLTATCGFFGSTILHNAAYYKNVAALQTITKQPIYQNILYNQNKAGLTALAYAHKVVHDVYDQQKIERPRIATIAALKYNLGYQIDKDPLFKTQKLPKDCVELWHNDKKLCEALSHERTQEQKQQLLKNEIQKVLTEFKAFDIDIMISVIDGIARASRYDDNKVIEVSPFFDEIPYKRPIILNVLAHHLLGHLRNKNERTNRTRLSYEEYIKANNAADDFAIKENPHEFIKMCQYCLDNYHNTNPYLSYHWERRIERAKTYLKKN